MLIRLWVVVVTDAMHLYHWTLGVPLGVPLLGVSGGKDLFVIVGWGGGGGGGGGGKTWKDFADDMSSWWKLISDGSIFKYVLYPRVEIYI